MTIQEYEDLKIGMLVCKKDSPESKEYWIVYDDYQFGPPIKVCGVKTVQAEQVKFGRIDQSNCRYWHVVICPISSCLDP